MLPEALQQLVTAAVAAAITRPEVSVPPARDPKLPKFWEQEPVAWFSVFRDHFEGKQSLQVHKFNTLLPLSWKAAPRMF